MTSHEITSGLASPSHSYDGLAEGPATSDVAAGLVETSARGGGKEPSGAVEEVAVSADPAFEKALAHFLETDSIFRRTHAPFCNLLRHPCHDYNIAIWLGLLELAYQVFFRCGTVVSVGSGTGQLEEEWLRRVGDHLHELNVACRRMGREMMDRVHEHLRGFSLHHGPDVECIDPHPGDWHPGRDSLRRYRPRKPVAATVEEYLAKETPYHRRRRLYHPMGVWLVWPSPAPDTCEEEERDPYDVQALRLLKPDVALILHEGTGISGSSELQRAIADPTEIGMELVKTWTWEMSAGLRTVVLQVTILKKPGFPYEVDPRWEDWESKYPYGHEVTGPSSDDLRSARSIQREWERFDWNANEEEDEEDIP